MDGGDDADGDLLCGAGAPAGHGSADRGRSDRVSGIRVSGIWISRLRISGFWISGFWISGFWISGFRDGSAYDDPAERGSPDCGSDAGLFGAAGGGDGDGGRP
ncbi:MAG TPA: hypothetical protein VH139_06140 [Acidobacteriaceae bacterium]|nr:hypothetical protein [Acidobacteriaceae bacterium]